MGWAATLFMGFVLGLLGGGGGILTVPILVGLFGLNATLATGASLFVVGSTALFGAGQGIFKKTCDVSAALTLAMPSALAAMSARRWLVPAIPDFILGIHRDDLLLGMFAVLMVVVAIKMLRTTAPPEPRARNFVVLVVLGLLIGVVSGTLGAGGGFLIVPVLTIYLGVEMSRAVPTSLLVIAIQSLVGFTGEIGKPIPYELLLQITGVALLGLGLGVFARGYIEAPKLRTSFAILILLVAGLMVAKIALQ